MATVVLTATMLMVTTHPVARAADNSSVNVVAHEDDDLLFLAPDLYTDLRAGRRVRTIFVTAGDAGKGSTYWQRREEGARAAYAQMLGVANSWRFGNVSIAGHRIRLVTLARRPAVSLVFMRLPSGSPKGTGYARNGNESLQKLWTGAISRLHAVDGSTSYTKASLQETVTGLMASVRPDAIHTQDYQGSYGDGDHSDHHTVGYVTRAASARLANPHVLVAYQGYGISNRPSNLSAGQTRIKQNAFLAYSAYDSETCKTLETCRKRYARKYYAWFSRQYTTARSSRTALGHVVPDGAGACQARSGCA